MRLFSRKPKTEPTLSPRVQAYLDAHPEAKLITDKNTVAAIEDLQAGRGSLDPGHA